MVFGRFSGTALSGVIISVPGEVERQVENNSNIFSLFLEMQ
jgi:hypothetical protein